MPNLFASKIGVELPPEKKVPWHQCGAARCSGSNCHFCQKNAFFGQKKAIFQKVHFIQKWSVTPNTIFGCVKNDFLLYNPKLVFFTELNLSISNCSVYCVFIIVSMSKLNFSIFPIYPAAWLRDKRRDVRKMGGQISRDRGEGHGEVSSPPTSTLIWSSYLKVLLILLEWEIARRQNINGIKTICSPIVTY